MVGAAFSMPSWANPYNHLGQPALVQLRNVPRSVGIIVFCFAGHPCFPIVHECMRDPRRWRASVGFTFLLALLFYGGLGVFGYLVFGGSLEEITSGKGKVSGKGAAPSRFADPNPQKRRALPGEAARDDPDAELPPALDDGMPEGYEDFIRQLCRAEFDSIKEDFGDSIAKTAAESNKPLLAAVENLRALVQAHTETLEADVRKIATPQLDSLSRRLQAQLGQQKGVLDAHTASLAKHDQDLADIRREMAELRKELALAESRLRPQPQVPAGFNRDIDTSLVVAISQRPTSVESMREVFVPWLSSIGFENANDEFQIAAKGTVPCKRFEIKFSGPIGVASRKVDRVLANFREGKEWNEFWITPPGDVRCRIHFGPDKSPKQIKQEIVLRRARKLVEVACPGKRLYSDRERGVLLVGWDKIMQIEVASGDSPPVLYWDIPKLELNHMEVTRVRDATKEITNPVETSQWSL
ncbi:unnamed protein product [Prorocentrum cordatum]|uniref:Amino acid transporter transmembrane domain-containing protein n=1 Tax=Prorocentrum cordatum TaxID=2364126 RepID=A0ABN9WJ96_9DINO|nr:unnamed protein product [Polarella glacialis]